MYLLNCFFIYSILGYIAEGIFTLITLDHFSSGILFGPWTPIYGIGAVLAIVISRKIFKKMHKSRFIETIVTFLVLALTLSIMEWLGGKLIEIFFHASWWTYSDFTFNIGKYTSLEMSLVWGIVSILVIYFVKPIVDKIVKKIPSSVTIIISVLFVIDLIVTLINNIK